MRESLPWTPIASEHSTRSLLPEDVAGGRDRESPELAQALAGPVPEDDAGTGRVPLRSRIRATTGGSRDALCTWPFSFHDQLPRRRVRVGQDICWPTEFQPPAPHRLYSRATED